jgi:flagellin
MADSEAYAYRGFGSPRKEQPIPRRLESRRDLDKSLTERALEKTDNSQKSTTSTTSTTATAQGNASEIAAALNAAKDLTGVSAKVDGTSGNYILSAADGRNITVTTTTANAGSTGVSNGTITTYGSLKLNSTSPNGIVLGGLQATTAVLGANAQTATATQVQAGGVSSVDLSTALGAQSALTILDKAIDTITNSRAAMGAYQNRLTASISNLETTSMNLQASRSRILDTDYAKETTNLAKSQIITQAATAMLAQANQSAQSVLALLK